MHSYIKYITKNTILYSHLWWQALFYLLPLAMLLVISFWTLRDYQLTPAFTTANYQTIFDNPVYIASTKTSLWLATSTALLATALSFPIAYAMTFYIPSRHRGVVICILLYPLLSNYVIRMFSWQLWLNDNGILAYALHAVGVLKGSLSLIYTKTATQIGLLSVLISLASLVIYMSVSSLNMTIIAAARNLGATPWDTFWRISFPFAMPGLLIAFLLSFIISFSDFVAANILGGNQIYTMSTLLIDRVKITDWPTAAALGIVMVTISLVVIVCSFVCLRFLPTTRYAAGREKN